MVAAVQLKYNWKGFSNPAMPTLQGVLHSIVQFERWILQLRYGAVNECAIGVLCHAFALQQWKERKRLQKLFGNYEIVAAYVWRHF